jgi:hypothetical protein
MKKQYVSLLILGIGICLTTGALAQNTPGNRRVDQQISAAKSQGLFKQTYTPFEAEQGLARRVSE